MVCAGFGVLLIQPKHEDLLLTAHISHFGALNFWRHLSVRSKSIIFVLMLIAGIYGMIVLFLYTAVEQNMEKQIHSKVLHLSRGLARDAADPLLSENSSTLFKLVEQVENDPLIRRAIITDPQGLTVASTQSSAIGRQGLVPTNSGREEFTAPIRAGSHILGYVSLLANNDVIQSIVDTRMDLAIRRLSFLGMITAFIGLIGASLISNTFTRPIRRLSQKMADVESRLHVDGLPQYSPIPADGDEITRLEEGFKRLEQRFQQYLVELDQLHRRQQAMQCMATIGEMSAQVAHEIRNALSSLRGAARYLVRYEQPVNRQEFINIIEEEVQRLYDMTQGFLDFGRPYHIELTEVPALDLLLRSSKRHATDLEAKQITLTINCPPSLQVVADPQLFEQAISNLLLNAVEALPNHGGCITLYGRREENGQFVAGVVDNGPGVPPERVNDIFKPYVTGKAKGGGLGLAVVTKIMMVHDGQVELRHREVGAEFALCLPPQGSGR